MRIFLCCAMLLLWCSSVIGAEEVTFEKDVRPILKAHCFQCHGEAGEREGELDLRLRRFIVSGGDSGPAIAPGKVDESLLLERVASGEMPPGEKTLSADDVLTLTKWVEAGALTARPEPETIGDGPLFTEEERNYWAFQPIQRPPVPTVKQPEHAESIVDRFLLAKLESEGLTFSASTDRRTFIRRATFDLWGMPPTPAAIEQFVNDTAPNAVERLIDRLLASPRYGERWGRHWLDAAGYADSEGYAEDDRVRLHAFHYRDYVIRSFNSDKPFNEFVVEQLAGDEMVPLPHKNLSREQIDRLAATGFLRMAPDGTASGGVDQSVARNEMIADTLEIVSTSLLGLTVGCARCHDHRYDPISQADYYRMRAIFEPALDWKKWKTPAARQLSLYTDEQRAQAAKIQAEAAKVDAERKAKVEEFIQRTLEEELETLEESMREPLRVAYNTPAAERTDEQKALLKTQPTVANIKAGSLYLYDRRRAVRAAQIKKALPEKEKKLVEETRQKAIEAIPAEQRDTVKAAWETAADKRTPEQVELLAQFPQVAVTAASLAEYNPEAAAQLARDRARIKELGEEQTVTTLKTYTDRAAEIRTAIPKQHYLRMLTEPASAPPETFVFFRGDHSQPKQPVEPSELTILASENAAFASNNAAMPTSGRRLAYAQHLTDGKHPLVARVIVNRIWSQHFGSGLVRSQGDFGFLGERPTHPELLDWLADEFMRTGWSIKQMHRLLMTSTVYQQSSLRTDQLDTVDPDNMLYARMSLRRLESEAVRDSILHVTGQYYDKMFGEAIPVMQDDVGQIVIGKENLDGERKPKATVSMNGEEFRRSLYVQVRRSRPLAVLDTFDAPAMTPNCTARNASNVAPQSLLLMNSRFVVAFSDHFARRLQTEAGGDLTEQLRLGWLLALGEEPTKEQLSQASAYVSQQVTAFEQADEKKKPEEIKRQALATYCQALLSATRFMYVE